MNRIIDVFLFVPGLFHKAISESGTGLVPWAEAPPGEALRNAFRLAKLLDCPQTPSDKMIACLRDRDSYDIINTEHQLYVSTAYVIALSFFYLPIYIYISTIPLHRYCNKKVHASVIISAGSKSNF